MLILLAALLSCFTANVPAAAGFNTSRDYYPHLSERTDHFSDGVHDRFTEIHLPCDEQFIGFAGTGNLRPITSKTEFNLTGSHTPHRYKVYDLNGGQADLMTEIVEHRCSLVEYNAHLSLN